ncbi:transposase [Planctomycetota bacterium]
MRPSAYIKPWLSIEKMFQWLQKASDESSYKRRLAIWLTYTGKLHAPKVAELLGISTQAVWLWIRQYNTSGPDGLERKGRGGRRWDFMTPQQEAKLLKPLISKARSGVAPKPIVIKQLVEKKVGRKVSMPYIYRLLARHGWSDAIAQSKSRDRTSPAKDNFQKLTRPWLRQD